MPSYDRVLWALRVWLDSWSGIGRIPRGRARQDFDLQLTRYDEKGWRAASLQRAIVPDHRAHGTLTGDATEPAWNGYLLPCGVVFGRWVTPLEAELDLLQAASLN